MYRLKYIYILLDTAKLQPVKAQPNARRQPATGESMHMIVPDLSAKDPEAKKAK